MDDTKRDSRRSDEPWCDLHRSEALGRHRAYASASELPRVPMRIGGRAEASPAGGGTGRQRADLSELSLVLGRRQRQDLPLGDPEQIADDGRAGVAPVVVRRLDLQPWARAARC